MEDKLDFEIKGYLERLRDSEDAFLTQKAGEILDRLDEAGNTEVPEGWVKAAKSLMPQGKGIQCPHCRKLITPFKKPLQKQSLWNLSLGVATLSAFGFSFIFPRYFIQFLVGALLLGVKWIVDQKAMKTQVLIYKALQEEESEKRNLRGSHRFSSKIQ